MTASTTTAADTKIWAYFDSTAFPAEDKVRRVLDVLADGPLTLPRIEADSGLRRGRLETLLKHASKACSSPCAAVATRWPASRASTAAC